jgi:polysaccharide pyruvyl transferase WcaK-like protein
LHISKERQAKNKMQKHKDILVAVPKSICNNLLYVIAGGQTVQSSTKAPSAHEPLGSVGGNKYICVFPMNLDKNNLVQYSFTLGTSCRQQKKKSFTQLLEHDSAFVVGHNCLEGLLVKD